MVASTQTQRIEFYPACKDNQNNFLHAWQSFDKVLKKWHVAPDEDSGFFNCRQITGGDDYSLHAYPDFQGITFWNGRHFSAMALAFDLNPSENPYGPVLITNFPRGMFTDVLAIRTNSGAQVFRCGAYYTGNKDAMHFEIVCSKADLASGINPKTVAVTTAPAPTIRKDTMLRIQHYSGEPTAPGDQPDVTALYLVESHTSDWNRRIDVTATHLGTDAAVAAWRMRLGGVESSVATSAGKARAAGTVFVRGPFAT